MTTQIPIHFHKSKNNLYLINPDEKKYLYVNNNNLVDVKKYNFLSITSPNKDIITVPGYTLFYFSEKFENDCLGFAERLNTGKYAEDPIFRECSTNKLFGDTDELNKAIAKEVLKNEKMKKKLGIIHDYNENANPEINEAYAIVLTKKEYNDEAPFHIGYVLFKDEYDNITLEADAGQTKIDPEFEIYGNARGLTNKTFYDRYKNMYSPGNVIVLQNESESKQKIHIINESSNSKIPNSSKNKSKKMVSTTIRRSKRIAKK